MPLPLSKFKKPQAAWERAFKKGSPVEGEKANVLEKPPLTRKWWLAIMKLAGLVTWEQGKGDRVDAVLLGSRAALCVSDVHLELHRLLEDGGTCCRLVLCPKTCLGDHTVTETGDLKREAEGRPDKRTRDERRQDERRRQGWRWRQMKQEEAKTRWGDKGINKGEERRREMESRRRGKQKGKRKRHNL